MRIRQLRNSYTGHGLQDCITACGENYIKNQSHIFFHNLHGAVTHKSVRQSGVKAGIQKTSKKIFEDLVKDKPKYIQCLH